MLIQIGFDNYYKVSKIQPLVEKVSSDPSEVIVVKMMNQTPTDNLDTGATISLGKIKGITGGAEEEFYTKKLKKAQADQKAQKQQPEIHLKHIPEYDSDKPIDFNAP